MKPGNFQQMNNKTLHKTNSNFALKISDLIVNTQIDSAETQLPVQFHIFQ